jgi:soluble lytic murein transglycosylase-like protein
MQTGFCIDADSHTEQNGEIVLRMGSGTLSVPASQVTQIRAIAEAPDATNKPKHPGKAGINTEEVLMRAADAQGLDASFVRSVAKVESGLRQDAVSKKGALGLMQLMPATASGLGVDPAQAQDNAAGGAKYLRTLLLRYKGDSALALAAYNAGPKAVDKYRGVPPYQETRQYVMKVIREYQRQQKAKSAGAAKRSSSGG